MKNLIIPLLLLFIFSASNLFAQFPSVFIPKQYKSAVKKGTRSVDGKPGTNYFQNRVDYSIKADFNPKTAFLSGSETINYKNNSADTIKYLVIRLYQNYLKAEALRQYEVDPADLNDGLKILKVLIDGIEINLSTLKYHGTNMYVSIPKFLNPNSALKIEIAWDIQLPNITQVRMGRYDSASYFVAYWYPQIAVYDDISGWCTESYTGLQEFYNEYGDFDVEIGLPKDFIAWATGDLQNESKIFKKHILTKINEARKSDSVISIITKEDLLNRNVVLNSKSNKWHFKAKNVSDFAFAASTNYVWDGTSVMVDSAASRRVMINSVYKMDSKADKNIASIGRHTIQRLSYDIIGIPYPYSHNTIWEGHFGMEFPMMCNDGPAEDLYDAAFVTSHEVSHSYFPFMVGTNEIHYAWIDEGLITFLPKEIEQDYGNKNAHYYINSYAKYAMGTMLDLPLAVPTTQMNEQTYMMQNYGRAAVGFYLLHDMIGKEMFRKVLQEYIHQWESKHPTPTDLFLILNSVTGQDWSWFWNPWFYEFGYADLSIFSFDQNLNSVQIEIRKTGNFPVPLKLTLTFEDNTKEVFYESAMVWKNASNFLFKQKISKKVIKVELGDKNIPDINLKDNLYMISN